MITRDYTLDELGRQETEPDVAVRLFGPMELVVNGQSIPAIRSRKAHWLLSLLALRQNQNVERGWLAGTLWPESTEQHAYVNLRQSVADLRRALGPSSGCIESSSVRTLRLQLPPDSVDVTQFKEAVSSGGEPDLVRAVALRRGTLLEGCSEEWVVQEREFLDQLYFSALEQLAQLAVTRGDHNAAIQYLRVVVTADPLKESAHRSLMQALACRGDHSAAIQVYRDLRLLLHREFKAEPDRLTTALFVEIRESARGRAGVAGSGRIDHQVPRNRRIPRPLTELIGREREVNDIILRLETTRLVTLIGAGGIGKTRLAIEAAASIANTTNCLTCFVELAAANDLLTAQYAIAGALELREETHTSIQETITDFLNAQPALIVLDNCEHLIDCCAGIACNLLAECPNLRILATSRQSLGINGEMSWAVPPLSVPVQKSFAEDVSWSPSSLDPYESVRFFVDRATSARHDFALTDSNADAVARICRRLDGIPLAIELAAARVKMFSPAQLDARLEESFGLLAGAANSTFAHRHKTINATLEWSYRLLSASERTLLHRLSVFQGAFTVEAVQAVAEALPIQPDQIVELLACLVDKSLVVVVDNGQDSCYRLLEVTRAFARGLLKESGEEASTCRRHTHFYLEMAEGASPMLDTPKQAYYLNLLEAGRDNIRAALDWLNRPESSENDLEVNLRLCAALARFWYIRGHFAEARDWLTRALERDSPSNLARAGALIAATLDDVRMALEPDTARSLLLKALEIYEALGNQAGIAECLYRLGRFSHAIADYPSAKTYYEKSLSFGRAANHVRGVSECLTSLGRMALTSGDNDHASSLFEQALITARKGGLRFSETRPLTNLGHVAYVRGDFAAARRYHTECLAINREMGAKSGIVWSLDNLGDVAMAEGCIDEARDLYLEGLRLNRDMVNLEALAECLRGLGCTELYSNEPSRHYRALRLFAASEGIRETIGVQVHRAFVADYNRALERARQLVGRSQFDVVWLEGKWMTAVDAMEYALSNQV